MDITANIVYWARGGLPSCAMKVAILNMQKSIVKILINSIKLINDISNIASFKSYNECLPDVDELKKEILLLQPLLQMLIFHTHHYHY